jgi:hypothetical protein
MQKFGEACWGMQTSRNSQVCYSSSNKSQALIHCYFPWHLVPRRMTKVEYDRVMEYPCQMIAAQVH